MKGFFVLASWKDMSNDIQTMPRTKCSMRTDDKCEGKKNKKTELYSVVVLGHENHISGMN